MDVLVSVQYAKSNAVDELTISYFGPCVVHLSRCKSMLFFRFKNTFRNTA